MEGAACLWKLQPARGRCDAYGRRSDSLKESAINVKERALDASADVNRERNAQTMSTKGRCTLRKAQHVLYQGRCDSRKESTKGIEEGVMKVSLGMTRPGKD